ncbi:MAG TPA: tripartite tricarboxylate transporter TctB family protein [Usitatibacter sp.]|nr:tripartite tricarboxylate transporter TctB family protein [Usitatibacter sp.]
MGRDGITGLVVLAASLGLLWGTVGLERHPMLPVGPGFYPRIVLGITALFALWLVVSDVIARRRAGPAAAAVAVAPSRNYALVAVAFATFAAYTVALPWLGFRLSTVAFLVLLPAVLERPREARRWALIVVVALVATGVVYYMFEHYLHVLLPRGRWTSF